MKAKAHTTYRLQDGTRVPGVTTFLGVLNKPALIKWANNLGLRGIDSTKYVDELADAGTLAHALILAYLKKEEADLVDYSEYQIGLAQNSFMSFLEWAKHYTIEPALIEVPLVSEKYKFGGTPDLLATVDGDATLVDFKTGKAIWPEHHIQVAAYRMLLIEHGYEVAEVKILRIGRDEDEGFEVKPVKKLDINWKVFLHCQAIYELRKQLARKGDVVADVKQAEKDIKELWPE